MTEQTTIRPEHEGRDKERCRVGSCTDHPCWREAFVPRFEGWASGPWVCREHTLAAELADEANGYRDALEKLQAWIVEARIGPEVQTPLMDATYSQREELEAQYLEAKVKAEAAALVASRGEDEEHITLEEAENAARRMTLSDTLGNARTALEDAPADSLPPNLDRFLTCAALEAVRHERASLDERGGGEAS